TYFGSQNLTAKGISIFCQAYTNSEMQRHESEIYETITDHWSVTRCNNLKSTFGECVGHNCEIRVQRLIQSLTAGTQIRFRKRNSVYLTISQHAFCGSDMFEHVFP